MTHSTTEVPTGIPVFESKSMLGGSSLTSKVHYNNLSRSNCGISPQYVQPVSSYVFLFASGCVNIFAFDVLSFGKGENACSIVFKASLKRYLSGRAHWEVKVSPHLEIRRKATVAATKN
jgi:hypothetical protein